MTTFQGPRARRSDGTRRRVGARNSGPQGSGETEHVGSERVSTIPRSGIRSVLERSGEPDVVSLAAGDPDFETPEHIVVAATDAMRSGQTHYTHGRGLVELREAFTEKLRTENGIAADASTDVVVTAGALNALAAAFLSTVDSGDRVLVPNPGFANYQAQVRLAGGIPVGLAHCHEDGFQPDLDELDRLAPSAKILVVNTPGNPTGAVIDRDRLAAVADLARRHDLLVVADEAYEHLVYAGAEHHSIATMPGMSQRTLTISSLSKSWAMTGWRTGFVTGPATLIALIAKVQEHLIGCPPAMTQWGGVAALTASTAARTRMVERYAQRRRLVVDAFEHVPRAELVAPRGAFYAFPRFRVGLSGYELAAAAADEARVITVPGIAFGTNGADHLRLSYATTESALAAGLERLTAWCAERVR